MAADEHADHAERNRIGCAALVRQRERNQRRNADGPVEETQERCRATCRHVGS